MGAWRRRTWRGMALLGAAALIAAGCGDDDGDGTGSGDTKRSEQVEPKGVTSPEPDEELTEEMGADGEALTQAGCSFGTYEQEEPAHVEDEDDLKFETFPPTSGTHFPEWAPFGLYEEQVPDGNVVHNLEHGGVTVWLGTEVGDDVASAVAELLDDEEKWLVSPRADLEGLFSAAWGTGLSCSPEALAELEPDAFAKALDTWYETVVSTGHPAEKDIPAYAGGMKEPTPERDISAPSPF